MGRRPEVEIEDADPPPGPIRPDEGYRVGARISAGDTGRTRLAGALAVAIVALGLAFASFPVSPVVPQVPVAPPSSRPAATRLPDIAVLQPPRTARFVPAGAGGLRWLDPATGRLTGEGVRDFRGSVFVDPLGRALCVCIERSAPGATPETRVGIRRYGNDGRELERVELYVVPGTDRRGLDDLSVEAAISPDGDRLWVARAVQTTSAWEVHIDRVDLRTLTVDASRLVDVIAAPAPSSAAGIPGDLPVFPFTSVRATLRVSPDGVKLAVIEHLVALPGDGPGSPSLQERRLVIDAGLDAPGTVTADEVAIAFHVASTDSCDSDQSAWATPDHFITICRRPVDRSEQPFIRIENPSDITREVAIGPPIASRDVAWLLDAARGFVYAWSTHDHVFSRFDVVGRSIATVAVDSRDPATGDIGIWPGHPEWTTSWVRLSGPDDIEYSQQMVGSQDGSLIFALGLRPREAGDRLESTGVWVFDAERVEVVARWAPEATYDQIGYAPVWERLITVALPGSIGVGAPDQGPTIRFHDARTGGVSEVIGTVGATNGFDPVLLEPAISSAISGF